MSCVRNGWGNSLILFIVLIGTVRSEGGFVCSDLITPHCDGGVINLWEVLWLTRQAQPPPHPPPPWNRAPLSLQTTQISKDNKRGAGKTADSAICMSCHSFYKHKVSDDWGGGGGGAACWPLSPTLGSSSMPTSGVTSTSLRVLTASRPDGN